MELFKRTWKTRNKKEWGRRISHQLLSSLLTQASELSVSDLETLIPLLEELKRAKRSDHDFHSFHFEASNNPNLAIPYVAKLSANGTQYERHFFELERVFGKNSVLVSGDYAVQEGEIVELCKGGNTQRKYRSVYLIFMGRLEFLGKSDDAKTKHHVLEYLTHKIDLLTLKNSLLWSALFVKPRPKVFIMKNVIKPIMSVPTATISF